MPECSVGGITVHCPPHASGCGVMCVDDICWVWCDYPPVLEVGDPGEQGKQSTRPAVVRVDRTEATSTDKKVKASDRVTMCARDLSEEGLISGLEVALDRELESAGQAPSAEEMPFEGTVAELLDHLNIREK